MTPCRPLPCTALLFLLRQCLTMSYFQKELQNSSMSQPLLSCFQDLTCPSERNHTGTTNHLLSVSGLRLGRDRSTARPLIVLLGRTRPIRSKAASSCSSRFRRSAAVGSGRRLEETERRHETRDTRCWLRCPEDGGEKGVVNV